MKQHNRKKGGYCPERILRRLERKGWVPERGQVELAPGTGIMVEGLVGLSHGIHGEANTLHEACKVQNAYERALKETWPERMTAYLKSKGWKLTEAGQWWRSNWSDHYEDKQRERLMDDEGNLPISTGVYASLAKAVRLQSKLDALEEAPEVEKSDADDLADALIDLDS